MEEINAFSILWEYKFHSSDYFFISDFVIRRVYSSELSLIQIKIMSNSGGENKLNTSLSNSIVSNECNTESGGALAGLCDIFYCV